MPRPTTAPSTTTIKVPLFNDNIALLTQTTITPCCSDYYSSWFFGRHLPPGNMSRHKLVKNLDLDDELDDYDGGEDYGDEGGDSYGTLLSSMISL